MGLWLVRAGSHGEYEKKFLEDNRVYLTWEEVDHDLSKVKTRQDVHDLLAEVYPNDKPNTIRNWINQVWKILLEYTQDSLSN